MKKTILITGATDGIGLETAKKLAADGHNVLIHGRSEAKLEAASAALTVLSGGGDVESFAADLSSFGAVEKLADAVCEKHSQLDVLINNAGVFKTENTVADGGTDVRFMVNTLAPFYLTRRLAGSLGSTGRVVNVSSAAQAPVDFEAMAGKVKLEAMEAYAQSKLAITMWSKALAQEPNAPIVIAVNPGSMLGSKMVTEGFGVAGGDLGIGADILSRAAVSDEFESASGQYFDNDAGQFGSPHPDANDPAKTSDIVRAIQAILADLAK